MNSEVVSLIRDLAGEKSVRDIAAALEEKGYETARGGTKWWPSAVQGIAKREGIALATRTTKRNRSAGSLAEDRWADRQRNLGRSITQISKKADSLLRGRLELAAYLGCTTNAIRMKLRRPGSPLAAIAIKAEDGDPAWRASDVDALTKR